MPPLPCFMHADKTQSQWRWTGRSMDPSGIAPTFPSSVQENQGLCSARLVPPLETSPLCCSPYTRCRFHFVYKKTYGSSQTQRYVRIYNLSEQKLLKMLTPGIRWISSMDVHPSGDHLIVGGYDRKLCWFDLELSEKPYKILRYAMHVLPGLAHFSRTPHPIRYHSRAIRSLHFHPSYPLFASSSDDGSIQVFHARVYSDLLTDPLIVPLKILRGHNVREGLGVLQVKWVPKQPWLVSAGADSTAAVWCH
jgi:WD40 repeat protein